MSKEHDQLGQLDFQVQSCRAALKREAVVRGECSKRAKQADRRRRTLPPSRSPSRSPSLSPSVVPLFMALIAAAAAVANWLWLSASKVEVHAAAAAELDNSVGRRRRRELKVRNTTAFC